MRDLLSCCENKAEVADSSSSSSLSATPTAQNLVVTCVYQCRFRDSKSCFITVTWTKDFMGHCFSVGIDDDGSIEPWLFHKKKGSMKADVFFDSSKVALHWDLSSARFGPGPEPLEGFYLTILFDRRMVFLLGDLKKEALIKTTMTMVNLNHVHSNANLIAKRKHIYGKRVFTEKVRFCDNGQIHHLEIECSTNGVDNPCLFIRVDRKMVIQVKRVRWNFRGSKTILVKDELWVEVYWDVHNWFFGASLGSAVFMFKTKTTNLFPSPQSQQGLGFSLILYAWKNE